MTLFLDAFERVLAEPQAVQRWHCLMQRWCECTETQARAQVRARVELLSELEPRADILRLTFLATVTEDAAFKRAAIERVLALEPFDPERLAAFMAFAWLEALRKQQGRADFVAELQDLQMPAMARRLTCYAQDLLSSEFKPALPTMAQGIQRVAIIAPYIGDRFHPPSVLAIEEANALAQMGVQAHIFSAQELQVPEMHLLRGDGRSPVFSPIDPAYWQSKLLPNVCLRVSDSRLSLSRRLREQLQCVQNFNPDVVFLVGFYSALAAALQTVRPLLGLGVNSVAPLTAVDVYLSAEVKTAMKPWDATWPMPQALFHPYRIRRDVSAYPVTRASLGLAEDAVVWLTVGFRLEHEIRDSWALRMRELLAQQPKVIWLLVGGEGQVPPALRGVTAERLRVLPTRADMPGVLRLADIYVNPPRMGGGFSVAEAMAEGLPVLALAGSDGGDKLGDQACSDLDSYFQALSALTASSALRAERGAALRRRFDECLSLAAAGPHLLAACRLAADLAAQRFK